MESVQSEEEQQLSEAFKRLQSQRGVIGVILFTTQGAPIKTTFGAEETASYSRAVSALLPQARNLATVLSPKEDLVLLRMNTKKNELTIVPEQKFTLVAVKSLDPAKQ